MLIKAFLKTSTLSKADLGKWKGLSVLALGPRGGKIIGYRSNGKPIYAGSSAGESLANAKAAKEGKAHVAGSQDDKAFLQWLLDLGITGKVSKNYIRVSAAAAELLSDAFEIDGKPAGEDTVRFNKADLYTHIGEPLKPARDEQVAWAASIASGQHEASGFPEDLSELSQVGTVGSHGVWDMVDNKGQHFYFKPGSQVIAQAELAASRLGQLVLGERISEARMVEIGNKQGVLLRGLGGQVFNQSSHSDPPTKFLKKYAPQIVQHEVLDWLISNHDPHAGNFLADGKIMNAIDKGQAWKWVGKDKLDPSYKGTGSPNPSYAIYRKFWQKVQDGTVSSEGLVEAAAETLEQIDKITDEQFLQIVQPYLNESGSKAKKLKKAMLDRLHNMRPDFEAFLSKQLGYDVKLPATGKPSLVAVPAVEDSKGQKLTIKVPGEPKTIAGEGLHAVPDEGKKAVPGWPIQKGSAKGASYVKVFTPGEPPPTVGKWPKGCPGPGYKANIRYKGQIYTLTMAEGEKPGDKPMFVVGFPNGNTRIYRSANAAGDSLYLFNKGLSLDMTATEKKAKKISLGSKVFRFKEFQEEFASAYSGGEISPSQMTPAELEKEKVVPPETKKVSTMALLKDHPEGVISDWGLLPHEVQEFLEANNQKVGSGWAPAVVPGVAVKIQGTLGQPGIVTASVGAEGQPEYQSWLESQDSQKILKNKHNPDAMDIAWKLQDHPSILQAKKELSLEPKTPLAPIPAEPSEANWETMPKMDAQELAGLPAGHAIKVSPPFSVPSVWIKSTSGQWVSEFGAVATNNLMLNAIENENHEVEHKVPATPSPENWETFKEVSTTEVEAYPNGTKIRFTLEDGTTGVWEKIEINKWQAGTGLVQTSEQVSAFSKLPVVTGKILKPVAAPVGEFLPVTVEPDVEQLKVDPVGTVYQEDWNHGSHYTYTKVGSDKWLITNVEDDPKMVAADPIARPSAQIQLEKPAKDHGTLTKMTPSVTAPVASEEDYTKYSAIPDQALALMNGMYDEETVAFGAGEKTTITKLVDTAWEVHVPGGKPYTLTKPQTESMITYFLGEHPFFYKAKEAAPVPEKTQEEKVGTPPPVELPETEYEYTPLSPNQYVGLPEHTWKEMVAGQKLGTGIAVVKPTNTYHMMKTGENLWEWSTITASIEMDDEATAKVLMEAADKHQELKLVQPKEDKPVVTVPPAAPKHNEGPLPVGTTVTVKKKWLSGKLDVTLTAQEGGKFDVTIFGSEGDPYDSDSFDSLSAASDWVWVKQKGFHDAADYKKKTGKNKVPSGGGWKFWGIKPGEEPKVVPPPTPEPEPPPEKPWMSGAYEGKTQLTKKPTASELHTMPVGTVLESYYLADKEVISFTKQADGKWLMVDEDGDTSTKFAVGVSLFMDDPEPGVLVTTIDQPKVVPPKGKANLPESLVTSPDNLSESMKKQWTLIDDMLHAEGAGAWLAKVPGQEHQVGEKSPLWPAWVPPAGAMFEGEWFGEKYYFFTSVSGYDLDGKEPQQTYKCAIMDSAGQAFESAKFGEGEGAGTLFTKGTPEDALLDAAKSAGFGTKNADTVKAVFDLKGAKFAPGETADTLMTGTGVSALPSVEQVSTGPAEEMAPAVKNTPVKHVTLMKDAMIKKFGSKLTVESAGGAGAMSFVTLTDKTGDAKQALVDLAQEHGITSKVTQGPKKTSAGAYMTLPTKILESEIAVETTALKAASEPNWETMPEGYPKTIDTGKYTYVSIKDALYALPVGAKLKSKVDGQEVVKEQPVTVVNPTEFGTFKWGGIEATLLGVADALADGGEEWEVIPPSGEVVKPEAAVPVEPKQKPVKELTEKQKAAIAAQEAKKAEAEAQAAKAKEIAGWAKANKAVSGKARLLAMSHLQKNWSGEAFDKKVWARQDSKGNVLLGSEEPGLGKWLKSQFGKTPHKVDTPLGTFYKVTMPALKKKFPTSAAVTGPDGKEYPAGTVFSTKVVEHPITDYFSEFTGFHKVVPDKKNPGQQMIKASPPDDTGVANIMAIAEKYGLHPAGEPVLGHKSAMLSFPKSELEQTKKETVPDYKIPVQPDPFAPAALPGFAAAGVGNAIVYNNRADLGMMDTIKPPTFGHTIRFGTKGVIHNHQIKVRKIKGIDGKLYHEVSGNLAEFNADQSKLAEGMMEYHKFDTTDKHGHAIPNNDTETGIAIERAALLTDNVGHKIRYEARVGQTDGGSRVEVATSGSHRSTFIRNRFRVRVPAEADIETELAAAFGKMGVDSDAAMAVPTEVDERVFIKSQIVQMAIGAAAHNPDSVSWKNMNDEEWLDKKLKQYDVEQYVSGATIRDAFQGQHSVFIDDADKIKKAGDIFAYSSVSSATAYLQGRHGWGAASRLNRYDTGFAAQGGSADRDELKGSAKAAFLRIGRTAMGKKPWGLWCAPHKRHLVIYHPRVLQRTDAYIYNHDEFGETRTTEEKSASSASWGSAKHKHLEVTGESNELVVHGGVSMANAAAICVPSKYQKQDLIDRWKQDGMTEINGIALDDFVVVYEGETRKQLASKIKGLQEGVLP